MAIDSALDQRIDDLEVVVTNDGSTDATQRILDAYGGRIQVVIQSNRGCCAARNAAVAASSGKYLAFLDADDELLPGKLAKSATALENNPDAVLAFSDLMWVDQACREIPVEPIGCAPTMDAMLARGWAILPSAVVMTRSAFDRCGGFCEEFKRPGGDDSYLWLLAREQGEFVYLPERLATHRTVGALELARKYERGGDIFVRLIRARYGARADALVRDSRCYLSALWLSGALALLDDGDILAAAAAWIRAIRHRPALILDPAIVSRFAAPRNFRRLARGLTAAARRG